MASEIIFYLTLWLYLLKQKTLDYGFKKNCHKIVILSYEASINTEYRMYT